MKTTSILSIIIATTLLVLVPTFLFAQGGPPKTPIDGGLSFLLAAGGAYGVKKIVDKRKEKQQ